jgi:chromosome segregation ATPase
MSTEIRALLLGIVIAAIPAVATYLVSRRRPLVDSAEATDTITAAAERVVKNVLDDNDRLKNAVRELRADVSEMRDMLRTARAEVSSLRAELRDERVAHEQTRKQVQTLLHDVGRLTDADPTTPPYGTPPVVG